MNIDFFENKNDFCKNYDDFMHKLAQSVWEWTESQATFYTDGVFDVDTWFKSDVRPLFILKEVNQSVVEKENIVNLVSTTEDPWIGKGMWGRIGVLAALMFQMYENPTVIPDYSLMKHSMSEISENGETKHQNICRKISIINLKKLAGGDNTKSEKSRNTLHFTCHAQKFSKELYKQIQLIKPTIIICCGKWDVANAMNLVDGKIYNIPAIDGYHPNRSSDENFYLKTLQDIKSRKLFDVELQGKNQ